MERAPVQRIPFQMINSVIGHDLCHQLFAMAVSYGILNPMVYGAQGKFLSIFQGFKIPYDTHSSSSIKLNYWNNFVFLTLTHLVTIYHVSVNIYFS